MGAYTAASPSGIGMKDSVEAASASGIAGQFVNVPGQGLLLQGISGSSFQQVFSVDTNGNLDISGTKSSTAKLQNGREVALYAVESPENWFEDFGTAELKNGVAWIPLDVSFAEATNPATTYHVFLTPNGDSNGLYVARKTAAGFEVREHGGGSSSVAFDYRIVARRRGYETVRLGEVQRDVKTAESSRQHLVALANSGTLRKAGATRAPRIVPAHIPPTIRLVPPRLSVPNPAKPNIPQPPRARK